MKNIFTNKLFLLSLINAVIIWLIPIANFYTRVSLMICLISALVTGLISSWPMRVIRFGFLSLIALLISAVLLPGREYNRAEFIAIFISELVSYQDTPYVWGGESRLGIDCSGLIRSSLVGAALKLGIRTANPDLFRLGISIWWHDATARQIGQGYRDLTYPVVSADSLNSIDYTTIQPGDLAVTASGIHILAYIGNNSWAEADPKLEKVVVLTTPQPSNPWFITPVRIVRLKIR